MSRNDQGRGVKMSGYVNLKLVLVFLSVCSAFQQTDAAGSKHNSSCVYVCVCALLNPPS